MSTSKGDPRVLFVMNLVLSVLFSWIVINGLAFIDVLSFSWYSVGTLAAIVMALTYIVVY